MNQDAKTTVPFGALICDDYGAQCDCCERLVRRVRGSAWHGQSRICSACFAIWYDENEIDPERIKAIVLERERIGRFPFGKLENCERLPM